MSMSHPAGPHPARLLTDHLTAAGLRVAYLPDLAILDTGDRLDVPPGKPAPDLYLAAAPRHLDVPPSRCLAVDDACDGVTAARAAGMNVLTLLDGRLAPAHEATL